MKKSLSLLRLRGFGENLIKFLTYVIGMPARIIGGLFYIAFYLIWLFVKPIGDWLSKQNWTGFKAKDGEKRTLWDWMDLLIVPVLIAAGLALFNKSNQDQQTAIQAKQATADAEIADDNRRETALQSYLDRMDELLLTANLGQSDAKSGVAVIAKTLTLTVVHRLDIPRRITVLRFLLDAELIQTSKPVMRLTVVDLIGADLSRADLIGADLSGLDLSGLKLSGANLSRANLSKAVLSQTDLTCANMSKLDLRGVDLTGALLVEVNLIGANLSGTNLGGLRLGGADLTDAILTDADLSNADLMDAILIGTQLTGANLSGIRLFGANLNSADLSGADLICTKKFCADLRGADLKFANLTGANLTGANLSGVRMNTATQMDENTILGDGTKWTSGTDLTKFGVIMDESIDIFSHPACSSLTK